MKHPEKVLRVIEILSDSLESHIPAALGDEEENECCRKAVGNPKFHLGCVKDYSEGIGLLGRDRTTRKSAMSQPKILTLDIETAPNLVYTWGYYEQNVIKVVRPWYVLMVGYKWADEKKPKLLSLHQYKGFKKDFKDDTGLLHDVWDLLDRADIVVTQNGDNFDIKKLNTRFLQMGLPPYSPFKSVDTKKTSKKHFSFINNKLDNLGEELGIGGKMQHEGFPMWEGCMAGNVSDFVKMGRYCLRDIVVTESVYLKERPWMTGHPNLNVWTEREACPACQSESVQFRGFNRSHTGKTRRFQCQDCGKWSQDSKSVRVTSLK